MTEPPPTSLIFAVGLQSRLIPHIDEGDGIIASALLLLKAARMVGRPAVLAELAHGELGETVAALRPYGQARLRTDSFDATRDQSFPEHVPPTVSEVLLVGAEAHDSIIQTGLGLLRLGKSVLIAADAIGARRALEKRIALSRLAQRGAEIVTVEMMLYEWLGSRAASGFADIASLIKKSRAQARGSRTVKRLDQRPIDAENRPDSEMAPSAIGDMLRQARFGKGLTLKEVAVGSQCSLSQLSKIENNKAIPSLPLLHRLSDVLGKDIKSFLGN